MNDLARQLLRQHGWEPGSVLGAGMEGTVLDLSSNQVAKVWHCDDVHEDLDARLRFGAALGRMPLPFRTSRTIDVLQTTDLTITIEEKVPGQQLRPDGLADPPVVTDEEARLMADALAGLSRATDPGLAELPVLPGEPTFTSERSFGTELADLAHRRFTTHPEPLRQELSDIDDLLIALEDRLHNLPEPESVGLVHGDLIPANVLTHDSEVAGVVDFGFLSTLGDPQFDAAVTASIFDMYGAHARESEDRLSAEFTSRFPHDRERYALYRAAYAVITCTWFGADETDGHFTWCMSMLRRPDVRRAVRA